jgi:hypothetical protein
MSKSFIMTIKTEAQDAIEAIKKIESHLKGEKDESVHVDIKEEGQSPIPATPVEQAPNVVRQSVGRAPEQKTTHNSWL